MATTQAVKAGNFDIQFGPTYDSVKMNRLIEKLQQLVTAVNSISTTATAAATQTPIKYVLATDSGLGPYMTVSGVIAGQVLLATSPTTAEFASYTVSFGGLAGVDAATFENPSQDDVIAFINGYWSAVPPLVPLGLVAPNTDVVLMWDPTKNAGVGGLSWAAAGTGIVIAPGSISAPPSTTSVADTPLTWLDM